MKLKNKCVKCDICAKIIKDPSFRCVQVFIANYEDKYVQGAMSDCEKELDVCNDCILKMNFKEMIDNDNT